MIELMQNPESYDPYEFIGRHYEGIDNVIDTYQTLRECVNSILRYDLFEKQMENLVKSFEMNLEDMLRKLGGS